MNVIHLSRACMMKGVNNYNGIRLHATFRSKT